MDFEMFGELITQNTLIFVLIAIVCIWILTAGVGKQKKWFCDDKKLMKIIGIFGLLSVGAGACSLFWDIKEIAYLPYYITKTQATVFFIFTVMNFTIILLSYIIYKNPQKAKTNEENKIKIIENNQENLMKKKFSFPLTICFVVLTAFFVLQNVIIWIFNLT